MKDVDWQRMVFESTFDSGIQIGRSQHVELPNLRLAVPKQTVDVLMRRPDLVSADVNIISNHELGLKVLQVRKDRQTPVRRHAVKLEPAVRREQ